MSKEIIVKIVKIKDIAQALPSVPLDTAIYTPRFKVIVFELYKMIEDESSVIKLTHDIMAPAKIPLNIIGMVIFKNVFSLLDPKEIAASSIEIGICCKVATEDRIVYGILLITMETTIIAAVPVSTRGPLENPITKAIPITEPGII